MDADLSVPTRMHGTLVEIAGVGVLLLGRSGIGKSECALELITRGHRLIADDVVVIEPTEDGVPLGRSPELVRHYIELRGIGIVHVPSLFGEDAVGTQARVDLLVQFEPWGAGDVERMGLDQKTRDLVGCEVAAITLPVAPGRNLATLVEVAARNHVLQKTGRSGAAELADRVWTALRSR